MAGPLRASIIIDLLGNISQRSRQFSDNIGTMARSSQKALRGLHKTVGTVSNAIDKLGKSSFGSLQALTAGALSVAGFKKMFLNVAVQRETMRVAINSLNHGNQKATQDQIAWILKNSQGSTWKTGAVMHEYRSDRGYGMSDKDSRAFIEMLEDQSSRHGWDEQASSGASLQLKEMYARGAIQAQDANLLTGYGINVYKVLADATGRSAKYVKKLGEHGRLGAKDIRLLFQLLADQARGAQKAAAGTWTGLTSQLASRWENFAAKVMDRGPFNRLKGRLKDALTWADSVDQDAQAERVANEFNKIFDEIERGARRAWSVLKLGGKALSWVDGHIVKLKTLAEVIAGIYLANKALRLGVHIARPTWKVISSPYRGYKRLRKRRKGNKPGLPEMPDIISNPSLVQQVYVTNWPAGGTGFNSDTGMGKKGKSRRKRGPGRGRDRNQPLIPSELPAAAPKGFFRRLLGGAGRMLGAMAGKTGGLLGGAGRWLASSSVGRMGGWLARTGAGRFIGSGLRLAGRYGSRLAGPLLSGAMLAPTLLDDDVSVHDKGAAVGSTVGAWGGGALGSLAGPWGTVAGTALGSVLGEYLGGWTADTYKEWTAPSKAADQPPPPEQKVDAQASLRIDLADGLRLSSSSVTENGMGLNIFGGDNYYPY